MSRLQTVSKVALVPLAKLEMFQKQSSANTMEVDNNSISQIKRLKNSSNANFRKTSQLNDMISNIVNDDSLGDDERLRKLLSALRHFILFRDKSIAYQTQQRQQQQQQTNYSDKKESSKDQSVLSLQSVVNNHEPATPFGKENDRYEGDNSPTRSLIKLDTDLLNTGGFEEKSIVSQLKGTQKSRGLELLDMLKSNPHFDWNERGNISIKGKVFPSSNINDLVNYEIIKYTKKGKEQLIPRNYDRFFNFLKSQNISPHKTSRESRTISVVKPSSIKKQLEFGNDAQDGQMIGEGFGSYSWESY
jgi:hypothetical protein